MAMNSAGDAIVSWRQYTGTGGTRQIWTRRWNGAERAWAADPELVSDDPGNSVVLFSATISDNGEAAVLYSQKRGGSPYRDAFVRRFDGAAWQDIVKVDSDLGDVGRNIGWGMGMDNSGNILAVWNQSDAEFANIWSAEVRPQRSAWAPATKLENAPFNAMYASVVVNSSGVATTIWQQPDATLFHIYASRTTLAHRRRAASSRGNRRREPEPPA